MRVPVSSSKSPCQDNIRPEQLSKWMANDETQASF